MKKTFRMILAIMLCILLLTAAFPGAAQNADPKDQVINGVHAVGYPIVEEKITLKVAAQWFPQQKSNYDDYEFLQDFEKKTNIHIEWINIPQDAWSEKKGLLFASNDMPDIVFPYLTASEIARYSAEGMLLPMNDLIDQFAPNIQHIIELRPEYKSVITSPDGNIYSLACISGYLSEENRECFFINQKWLDTLGLKMPTTTEEYREVLRAFKTQDPNGNGVSDEIPLSLIYDGVNSGFNAIFGSFGVVDNAEHLGVDENGKVFCTAIQEEWKDAVTYFNSLYAEGLIDMEVFSQDSAQFKAKGTSEPEIYGSFVEWGTWDTVGADRVKDPDNRMYEPMAPLKGPDGEQLWQYHPDVYTVGGATISATTKHPEACMRWLDTIAEPAHAIQFWLGAIGHDLELVGTDPDTYNVILPPEGSDITPGEWKHMAIPVADTFPKFRLVEDNVINVPWNTQLKMDYKEFYRPYWYAGYYPLVSFTAEESERLSELTVDIVSYIDKMKAQWIMHGGIENEWSNYKIQLDRMGLAELMEIYQAAYDRYVNAQ